MQQLENEFHILGVSTKNGFFPHLGQDKNHRTQALATWVRPSEMNNGNDIVQTTAVIIAPMNDK